MKKFSKTIDLFLNVICPLVLGYIFYLLDKRIGLGAIRNYMPDGLWAYAFLSCILIIWNREVNFIWVVIIMLFSIIFEMLQYLHFIKGTGDFFDIITYFIFFGIALSANKFFISTIYLKLTNYEED